MVRWSFFPTDDDIRTRSLCLWVRKSGSPRDTEVAFVLGLKEHYPRYKSGSSESTDRLSFRYRKDVLKSGFLDTEREGPPDLLFSSLPNFSYLPNVWTSRDGKQ